MVFCSHAAGLLSIHRSCGSVKEVALVPQGTQASQIQQSHVYSNILPVTVSHEVWSDGKDHYKNNMTCLHNFTYIHVCLLYYDIVFLLLPATGSNINIFRVLPFSQTDPTRAFWCLPESVRCLTKCAKSRSAGSDDITSTWASTHMASAFWEATATAKVHRLFGSFVGAGSGNELESDLPCCTGEPSPWPMWRCL